jgi:hypothetical protein
MKRKSPKKREKIICDDKIVMKPRIIEIAKMDKH